MQINQTMLEGIHELTYGRIQPKQCWKTDEALIKTEAQGMYGLMIPMQIASNKHGIDKIG